MIATYKLVPKTWTKLSDGEGVTFQVLYGDSVYWKYSTTLPTDAPYVAENCFYANLKQMYTSTRENGEVYVYTADPDGAFVSVGEKEITDTRNYSKYLPVVITPLSRIVTSTTNTAITVVGSYTIIIDDATDVIVGNYILMYNKDEGYSYEGYILAVVGTTLTMDTQLNVAFPIGSNVDNTITNMNVDGSVTPLDFYIRGTGPDNLEFDFVISRIIFYMVTDSAVDLNKFGDLPALERGITLSKTDGEVGRIFNVKSNGEIANIAFDFDPYSASHPTQGIDGLSSRLTFGGDSKIGAAIRLTPDEDINLLIQDDLTDLLLFRVMVEGYVLHR